MAERRQIAALMGEWLECRDCAVVCGSSDLGEKLFGLSHPSVTMLTTLESTDLNIPQVNQAPCAEDIQAEGGYNV